MTCLLIIYIARNYMNALDTHSQLQVKSKSNLGFIGESFIPRVAYEGSLVQLRRADGVVWRWPPGQ